MEMFQNTVFSAFQYTVYVLFIYTHSNVYVVLLYCSTMLWSRSVLECSGLVRSGDVSQMMPNWASSCSSKWLKASQGHTTVKSVVENESL